MVDIQLPGQRGEERLGYRSVKREEEKPRRVLLAFISSSHPATLRKKQSLQSGRAPCTLSPAANAAPKRHSTAGAGKRHRGRLGELISSSG